MARIDCMSQIISQSLGTHNLHTDLFSHGFFNIGYSIKYFTAEFLVLGLDVMVRSYRLGVRVMC